MDVIWRAMEEVRLDNLELFRNVIHPVNLDSVSARCQVLGEMVLLLIDL